MVMVIWTSMILLALVGGTTLTGRFLVRCLDIRFLRAGTPENALAAALLGTATWILIFGWCSQLGLHAGSATAVVYACSVGFGIAGLLRTRHQGHQYRFHFGRSWLYLLCPLLVMSIITLYPCWAGTLWFYSDVHTYLQHAEWLQNHSFVNNGILDPTDPNGAAAIVYLHHSLRMGGSYLLALVLASSPGADAFVIFMPTMAWAITLNLAAIYLVCRWCFHANSTFVAISLTVIAFTPNALTQTMQLGFYHQLFGTAFTYVLFAFGQRVVFNAPRLRCAWPYSLCLAASISTYSEMAPIAGLIAVAHAGQLLTRKLTRLTWRVKFTFLSGLAIQTLLLTNFEILRAIRALLSQMEAVCGWDPDYSLLQLWSFAIGSSMSTTFLMLPLTALVIGGLVLLHRHRRNLPIAACLWSLGALAIYFAFFKHNPWNPEELGQPWSLFKLCKWSFPIIAVVEILMAIFLLRKLPRYGQAAFAAVAILGASIYGVRDYDQLLASHRTADRQRLGTSKPLFGFRELAARLSKEQVDQICLVDEESIGIVTCKKIYAPIALSKFRFDNTWKGSLYALALGYLQNPRPIPPVDRTLFLTYHPLPHVNQGTPLPMGFTRLPTDRPVILGLANARHGQQIHETFAAMQVGEQSGVICVWSTKPTQVNLTFGISLISELSPNVRCTIRVTSPDGKSEQYALGRCLQHRTGCAVGQEWVATPGKDTPNALCFGPFVEMEPKSRHTALFHLSKIPTTPHDPPSDSENAEVATVDVYDSVSRKVLASRIILDSDCKAGVHEFSLPFTVPAKSHCLEYRTFWPGTRAVRFDNVSVSGVIYPAHYTVVALQTQINAGNNLIKFERVDDGTDDASQASGVCRVINPIILESLSSTPSDTATR